MRWAAKRDTNEKELLTRARLNGWFVHQISSPGAPDWTCIRDGAVVFVDVKMPDGELKPLQEKMFPRYADAGSPVHLVVTEDDVDRVLPPRVRRGR